MPARRMRGTRGREEAGSPPGEAARLCCLGDELGSMPASQAQERRRAEQVGIDAG